MFEEIQKGIKLQIESDLFEMLWIILDDNNKIIRFVDKIHNFMEDLIHSRNVKFP